ncbi:hypothetical protein D3C81_693970 [compost metagenome]
MAAPVISWYKADNTTQVTSWDIGTVDAGTVSNDTTFLIWNNRAGTGAVSDMTACAVTTKDSSGGNNGEIITNKWIEIKVDSMNESTFTPIGGTTTKTVQAAGAAAGTISGAVNDGTTANAAVNFAKITVHANVPAIATAGNVSFLTRIAYQYV